MDLTHASFFSGVGGLDIGLERAGWTTVSFSEIDPYASAVLAERWPDIINLGDIISVAGQAARERIPDPSRREPSAGRIVGDGPAWTSATLWSGGFPCQDLSIAGKRAGFEGDRSSLAFTFLDLVERYRPPAILFENVPGLLSSHGGRDMARLLREMGELGYGVAWRSLDAQYFGVPQRRLRVFLVGLRSGPDDPDGHLAALRAAEVLAVGTRCGGHPAPGSKKGPKAAGGPRIGLEIAGGLTRRYGKGVNTTIDDGAIVIGQAADVRRDGAADGPARRSHDSHRVEVAEARDRPWRVVCPDCGDWACGHHRGHIGEFCSCCPCDDCGDLFEALDEANLCQGCAAPEALSFSQNQRGELRTSEIAAQLSAGGGKPGQGYSAVLLRATDVSGSKIAQTLRGFGHGWQGQQNSTNAVFVKARRAQSVEDEETWVDGDVSPTINIFDTGDVRATTLIANSGIVQSLDSKQGGADDNEAQAGHLIITATLNAGGNKGGFRTEPGEHLLPSAADGEEDPLLPPGLDSNRYRACGNAVVVNVAEWLGHRLRHALEDA